MRGAAISLCLLGLLAGAGESAAGEPGSPPPAWLVFGGVSAGADYAASYTGAIFAPGGDLWQPGLRLRPAVTAGFYGTGPEDGRRTVGYASTALLAGWQVATGDRALAVHGGAEAVYFAGSDPPHFAAGWHLGVKVLAEASLQLSERTSLEGHVGYGSAWRRFEASAKLLTRVAGPWRAGPAASFFDKPDGRDLRLGVAIMRRQPRSGLSISAGLSLEQDKSATPYLGIGLDHSF
ncbi:MAG TPA: cellulose biosynthesis protein BcsS [Afifellaceae bacterium]|nr:cellulose biosynthesis protein BcsS [Afifellaceae bacterium]